MPCLQIDQSLFQASGGKARSSKDLNRARILSKQIGKTFHGHFRIREEIKRKGVTWIRTERCKKPGPHA